MTEIDDFKSLYSFVADNISDADILEGFQSFANSSDSKQLFFVSIDILVLLIILYGTVSFLAIIGNGIVIFVVLRRRNMRTVTNIFIANLACADIYIGIFSVPFQFHTAVLQRWVAADVMCKIAPFMKNLSVNISILTLTVISIDRYIAVIYPLRAGFRKKIAICVLLGIWLLSILSAIPDLIYFDVKVIFDIQIMAKTPICQVQWPSKTFSTVYSIYKLLLQYLVPLFVISVSYFRIVCKIWGNKAPGATVIRGHHTRTFNRKKVVKMLIIVTTLFAICWLPLQSYNLINAVYKGIDRYKYINIIWFCSNWLAMSNSCYNPFIYGLLNEKFQQEFKSLCRICSRCDKPTLSSYTLYNSSDENPHKTLHYYQSTDSCNGRRHNSRPHINKKESFRLLGHNSDSSRM